MRARRFGAARLIHLVQRVQTVHWVQKVRVQQAREAFEPTEPIEPIEPNVDLYVVMMAFGLTLPVFQRFLRFVYPVTDGPDENNDTEHNCRDDQNQRHVVPPGLRRRCR